MILVDRQLERRQAEGRPIRVGMVGAGFMGRGVALQLCGATPGMTLAAIANRHLEGARRAYAEAGVDDPVEVHTVGELEAAIERGRRAITDDESLICRAGNVDAVLEITGAVEFGAAVALLALEQGKHHVMMNVELDATVGPILRTKADRAGVVITNADGDQPGVILNLYRFVRGIGVRPVLCGNIKGLHDPYRNPTTQEAFARRWKQKPHMVTSFADGSKISFEQAAVANATGMGVVRRGMLGPTVETGTSIQQAVEWYPLDEIARGPGVVDYVVGAVPAPGVFVIGSHEHPTQRHYLELFKLGPGPFYVFQVPYHLCHFEVPSSIARAVDFRDATIVPRDRPYVDVVAAAKVDLGPDTVLDGIGGYHTYGLAESAEATHGERLLPMGLAEGCRLRHAVPQDRVLTYDDVVLPAGRLADRLRREQDERFLGSAAASRG